MARQILPAIDLRTEDERRGVNRTIEHISSILETLGKIKESQREREQLDRITRAMSGGATVQEAINDVVNRPPEQGTVLERIINPRGFSGVRDRDDPNESSILSGFAPAVTGISKEDFEEAKTGFKIRAKKEALRRLQFSPMDQDVSPLLQTLLDKPIVRGTTKRGGRTQPRKGVPAVAAPSKQQKQRDRDIAILRSEKGSEFQRKEARARIDKDPSQPRNPVQVGAVYDELLNEDDKVKGKFGKRAYNTALIRAEDEARLQGLDPQGIKADFDRWWDERVENERTGPFGGGFTRNVTTPRAEFQEQKAETTKELDAATAQAILSEAGGDKERARQIAKERGFKF